MTETHLLEVRGMRRRLAGRDILLGVDVDLRRGEMLTLVGPSGCGKSTLLQCIAGLEPTDAGTVTLDGRDLGDVPVEKRGIGMVFQDDALFGHMRVDANVAFGLRHLGRADRAHRVAEMLDLMQLGHLARRFPHQLSGGEQQRVALARALAPRPAVVLLDEPLAALDGLLRESLGWEVKQILASLGISAILVTHDRREALSLGDRVAVMHEGRILCARTPGTIADDPLDPFVAEFLRLASPMRTATGGVRMVRTGAISITAGGADVVLRVEFDGAAHRYTVRTAAGDIVTADNGPVVPLVRGEACTISARTG